ncbi:MAG: hypothetical protein GX357_10425 [Firmicutes bacterium]|nr:hypothetical protein [Bacillota bacterium]
MSPAKSMLFLPRKLANYRNKIFLAFDLSAVPPDMQIIFMTLYLPLFGNKDDLSVISVRTIKEKWSPKRINVGKIPGCSAPLKLQYQNEQTQLSVNVTRFRQKWRRKNYGLCLELNIDKSLIHFGNQNPYLLLSAI